MPLPGMPGMPTGMPIPPGIGGGMPGGGTGPVPVPKPMGGNVAGAMSKIRNAMTILQESLPSIPMGSPLHSDILSAVKTISKHMEESGSGEATKGIDIQSLLATLKNAQQNAPMAAMAKMGAPPTAPAMPGAA